MKRTAKTKPTVRTSAKIADAGRVQLGAMSPAFQISGPTKRIADKGKVRLGAMSPSF